MTYGTRAEWPLALESGRAAEVEFEKICDQWELATVNVVQGSGYYHLGNWDQAEAYAMKSYAIGKAINHIIGLAYAVHVKSEIASRLGPDMVIKEIDEVFEAIRAAGDRFALCLLLHAKGRCLTYLGRLVEAEEHFREGIQIIHRHFVLNDYVIALYIGQCEVLLRMYDEEVDRHHKRRLLRQARKTVAIAGLVSVRFNNYFCQLENARA